MSAEVDAAPRISDKQLLEEFRAFAGRNALFRRGKLDGFMVSITEGEVIEDVEKPTDAVSLEYYFSANRHRLPVDVNEIEADVTELPKPHVFTIFKIGMVAMMDQTTLPPHILEQAITDDMVDADNTDPDEMFSVYHRLEFMISTSDRWMRAAESYEYMDHEGDVICETKTDTGSENEIEDDLPEGTVALFKAEREQKEAELREWLKTTGLAAAEFELAEDKHDQDLLTAYQVFGNFKQALACYH